MVSTDLHGNGDDFYALRRRFEAICAAGTAVHWVLLGDLVHAPSPEARAQDPELYDFEDASWAIVDGVCQLRAAHPDRVHLVIGNHDYAHVGGTPTNKFYPDEAGHLEEQLTSEQVASMRALFTTAYLVVAAPCGLLLAHGSPGRALTSPAELRDIVFGAPRTTEEAGLIREILTSYGQPGPVTHAMLARMSEATGLRLRIVVHGHDRAAEGWFTEGGNQLQPVLFGAPRYEKRYLELDLSLDYEALSDLRDDRELRRLHFTIER